MFLFDELSKPFPVVAKPDNSGSDQKRTEEDAQKQLKPLPVAFDILHATPPVQEKEQREHLLLSSLAHDGLHEPAGPGQEHTFGFD